MSLIRCSECGKEVSSQAQACPYCGCPVKAVDCVIHFNWGNMKGNTFYRATVVIDGQLIGEMKCGGSMDCNVSEGVHEIKLLFRGKCAVQETVTVSREKPEEYFAYKQTMMGLKRVPANSVKWKGLSSNRNGSLNIPVCPTCGSQKIKKLSMTGKVAGVGMFGLASASVGKTFVCKNCGYKW